MKRLTILIDVPDDYDLDPIEHRITEFIAEVKGKEPTEADAVPDDVKCPSLELCLWQEDQL